ncbi:F-box/LRR-repeat protein 7 isoform X1 [Bactrocera dorsalis]|uniref:F-box/LRR-repeat protein 7 isoform X1 n=3 Tax=Bactrocera dorsalis TaxID=27457 RepID=A0A6J0RL24_BACDO|nr:F-box/LRR-repeat protein 7 isoform X1 [Bactrocera dorsalis]
MSIFDVLALREYSRATFMMSSVFTGENFAVSEDADNQNFSMKHNRAYTEDNVLVYNIFVYSIPKQFTENDVRDYFTTFGNVIDVNLVPDKKKSRRAAPKVGFVNFSDPESAASVLEKNTHRLQGWRIGVKAGDSWNQPNAEKACSVKVRDSWFQPTITSIPTDGTNFTSLNDDCLEIIFGMLELKEQVRFARVCQRFHDIFQMHCKREFKNFDLYKMCDVTLWEIRDFFRFAGENIESIYGSVPYKNRKRIVEFIRTFCTKLKTIKLDDSKMNLDCLKKLLRRFPHLQALALRDCALSDVYIETMTHLKHLETLELPENYELTGKSISKLTQLKVLNLYGCCNIQTSHLVDICESLPNLKALDIRRCERLSPALLDVMIEHCKELEILKMSCPEFPYERVALLPKLKHLELLYYSLYGTSQKRLLAELVAHKADQFEILKIVAKNTLTVEHIDLISELRQLKVLFVANNPAVNDDALDAFCKLQQLEELTIKGCGNITNRALLRLVQSCKQLRLLNIQFCKKITMDFLLETIRALKATEQRKKTLQLIVYGTSMDYYGVGECEEYKEAAAQSLVKVIFHASNKELGLEEGVDIYNIWDGEHWVDDEDDLTDDYDDDDDEDLHFPDSDMDDDDINFVYDVFGVYPPGHDINDVIW